MKVHIIPILSDNYAYVIQSGEHVAVIDPGEAQPVIEFLEENNLPLHWIINTHKHVDHTAGNNELIHEYRAKVAAPAECGRAEKLLQPRTGFHFGEIDFEVIATPGHTAGHVVLFDPTYRILFAGDTLFAMGCGRVFEGTMEEMYDSMQKIKALPPETAIYCGHEYTAANIKFAKHVLPTNLMVYERASQLYDMDCTMPTTLADELVTNPFLIAKTLDEFTEYRRAKDNF
jgi:hydroxyacylglutathione hydrolase